MSPIRDEDVVAPTPRPDGPPTLTGSRCAGCATTVFPRQDGCPRCARPTMADRALPDRGTVWTWTVQRFPPKPPYRPPAGGFAPFALGYVDLGALLVESRLLVEPDRLRIGLPVRLSADPPDGLPFAFEEIPGEPR